MQLCSNLGPEYRFRNVYKGKKLYTYCEPDCRLNNGGCQEDEVCSLREGRCIAGTDPKICPRVAVCTKRPVVDANSQMNSNSGKVNNI